MTKTILEYFMFGRSCFLNDAVRPRNCFPKGFISFCKVLKPMVQHLQKFLSTQKTKLFLLTANSLVIIMQIIYQPNRKRTLPFSRFSEKNTKQNLTTSMWRLPPVLKLVQKHFKNEKFKAHTIR